jgi:MraZ protein
MPPAMDRFVSTFRNRIDAKGRVSVPAPFRAVIAKGGFDGVFCHPSPHAEAIDAGGQPLFDLVAGLLTGLDPYSDERDELATVLFGESESLKIDQDGRIILTEALRAHAAIAGEAVFVGLGDKFQIWEPSRFHTHLAKARETVREHRKLLGAGGPRAPGGDVA